MGSVASVRPANSRLTNQRGSANLVMSDRATTRCALCLEPNPLPQSHVGPLTTLPTSKTNKKNSISTTHSFPATFFPSAQPLRPQHRHHPHPTGSPSLSSQPCRSLTWQLTPWRRPSRQQKSCNSVQSASSHWRDSSSAHWAALFTLIALRAW